MQAGNGLTDFVFPELAERLGQLSWLTLPTDQPGSVELEPSIKLSTLPVPHSPSVAVQALRLDFQVSGRSLVYSGDTTFNEEMVDFAAGCDLLVHEANFSESLHPDVDAASMDTRLPARLARLLPERTAARWPWCTLTLVTPGARRRCARTQPKSSGARSSFPAMGPPFSCSAAHPAMGELQNRHCAHRHR